MIEKMKERKAMLTVGAVIVLAVLVLAVIFVNSGSDQNKLTGLLDLGQKYLEEMSYEDAILVFDEAIAIDPKCAQAYMGKAKAQYSLGQYEEAVATLHEGIEQVGDSTELEAFLQQILDEMSAEAAEEDVIVVEEGAVEVEEQLEHPLLLNYASIVRRIDTEEPNIQLEVLGGEEPEHYTWESDNPECVTVSETGLLTCLPVVGQAIIKVSDGGGGSDYCYVQIADPEDIEESENFRMEMGDGKDRLTISLTGEEEQREIQIVEDMNAYVYHSGDVSIPEQLTYKGQNIPVTSITSAAYMWCNTMESISIPASVDVEIIDEFIGRSNPFYYCLALEEINVNEDNPFLKSVDGVLYSRDGKKLLSYPAAKRGSTYTIPSEVEKICPGAFVGCRNLEEILVGEENTYYRSIDGVLMDKENQLVAYPIGRKTASYSVPEEITQIAQDAFYMSELEEVICRSVENITSESFRKSKKLKRIEGGALTKSIVISGRRLETDHEHIVETAGIDEMHNLEQLHIDFNDYETDSVKTEDLQEWGNLENLKSLYMAGIHDSSGLVWLKDLSKLKELSIWGDEISNDSLYVCQHLADLEAIDIHDIKTLSDISWIENLHELKRFDIEAGAIEIEDFSQLFELPNLRYVHITNHSESNGLKEWFEAIQAENPNITIYYSEY